MKRALRLIVFIFCLVTQFSVEACTIVAVSGKVTADGRPLLLKNRDSSYGNLVIKISNSQKYTYLYQYCAYYGNALAGYNNAGFSIVNSDSYNMPNSSYGWNAYIMELALANCATIDEFEHLLDSLSKPMPVASNYGVMDALGNVAIIETNAYNHIRYDADSTSCGYLVRTNFSLSQDTTGVSTVSPTSQPRYQIATTFLNEVLETNGYFEKEDLFVLTRCLVNRDGEDLRVFAPYDENTTTPVEFRNYIPRHNTSSGMIIQGVLNDENPSLTVAWTMVGPPLFSVTVPYIITPRYALPQKAQLESNEHSWFSRNGQQLKNSCFLDSHTIDLAKLYNLCGTGVLQKICNIEEAILDRGNKLVEKLRNGEASCYDIEAYYSWVDSNVEEQYEGNNLTGSVLNGIFEDTFIDEKGVRYYDLLGRSVREVRKDAIVKKNGNIGIIILQR